MDEDAIVEVGDSRVPNGGRGVFALRDVAMGVRVTRYPGRVVRPDEYFVLDAKQDPLIDFAIALPVAAQALVPNDISCEGPMACGHKINDAACISLGTTTDTSHEAIVEEFSRQLCAYMSASDGPSPYNVRFDAEKQEMVTTRGIIKGEEIYLRYGVAYWASRVYSRLYWENAADGDRELARKLLAAAGALTRDAATSIELPPLPPRAVLQASGRSFRVVDAESGAELSDDEVLLAALSLFNRDVSVLRLPKPARRKILERAMVAASATPLS